MAVIAVATFSVVGSHGFGIRPVRDAATVAAGKNTSGLGLVN
jgi:hypothetical protein